MRDEFAPRKTIHISVRLIIGLVSTGVLTYALGYTFKSGADMILVAIVIFFATMGLLHFFGKEE